MPTVGFGTLATTDPVGATAAVSEAAAGARVGGPEASVCAVVEPGGAAAIDRAVRTAGTSGGCGMAQAR